MKLKRIVSGMGISAVLLLVLNGQSKGWTELRLAPCFSESSSGQNLARVPEQAGKEMLQYRAGGHILGFTTEGVLIASGTHALKVDFVEAGQVQPVSFGDSSPKKGSSTTNDSPSFTEVSYPGLWPGITLKYEGKSGGVAKSTYEVSVGADPNSIKLRSNVPVEIDQNGLLHYLFETGEMIESKPIAWQEIGGRRVEVKVDFLNKGDNEIGFFVEDYDRDFRLIIDPELSWITLIGGSIGFDQGFSIAIDNSGNIYMTGESNATWGNPINPFGGSRDAFVAKINSSGVLEWSTFLGGNSGHGIAVDDSGNTYIVGESGGTWGNPINPFGGGDNDAFVAKLDSSGMLQWNTFLGSSNGDLGYGISIDSSRNIYLRGESKATWGSPILPYGDYVNMAFVAKLDSSGVLQWNTFFGIGGKNNIVVDGSGNSYITGIRYIPMAPPMSSYTRATMDVIVAKLNPSGVLQWNTSFGCYGGNQACGIAVDGSGNTYVVGESWTKWGNPINPFGEGDNNTFVAKLDSSGVLQWNTFLGSEGGNNILVDGSGNIYVVGESSVTWGDPIYPLVDVIHGDPFMAKLFPNGMLQWNTFLGDGSEDSGNGIAIDNTGNVYAAGTTNIFLGKGNGDAFLAKISADTDAVISPNGGESWIAGTIHNITWTTMVTLANVKLEYSTNSGANWTTIIASTPNTYKFAWTVPNDISTDCLVRISDAASGILIDSSDTPFSIVIPPVLTITSPNGGESWIAGTIHNITWTTTGTVTNVMLEYSTSNGEYWTTIIASTANKNAYAWTVPYETMADCLVRVSEVGTETPTSDTSDAVFAILPPTFTVTSPNGGESWIAGSIYNITWTTMGILANVKLEYSTNSGANWTTIIASTANENSYAWTVPNTLSASCLVRVSEGGVETPSTDTSDAVFSIVAPTFTVTSPNGGERWVAGSIYNITWTTMGTLANVKLEFSPNNGAYWMTIISSTANTNTYAWTVPADISTNCLVRVSEAVTGTPTDTSDAVFFIVSNKPSIGLSKTSFNFGTERNGTATPAETMLVMNTGNGTLNWTAAISAGWLSVSPGSGTGGGKLTISIINTNLLVGSYQGMITISDPNATNSPQTITVILTVKQAGADSPPFGNFATPVDGSTVRSSIPVTGWALDDIGMKSVKIFRGTGVSDRIYIGDAMFVEGARPDVKKAYPTYPQNSKAGWGYMLLTNFLPNGGNGSFTLLAYAKDTGDHEVLLGSKTIISDNTHAVKPFGAIDTPAQGGPASGASYVNFGWALTPQPNSINSNGSTIWVYVDGLPLGHPTYNNYRRDIATLFPGYANSNGAVGYYYLDTTEYTDGVHTIAWSVTDTGGNSDGIGSRYFTIQNAAGGTSAEEAADLLSNSGTRSADELSTIPEDAGTPVFIKRGWGDARPTETLFSDADGSIRIEIPEVSRVAIFLNENDSIEAPAEMEARGRRILIESRADSGTSHFEAYALVFGEIRPLPIGVSFDPRDGVFYWQPGPGFLGEYTIVFVKKEGGSELIRKTVIIKIVS